jgi:very-short-patch-repair endonuclease
MVMTKLTRTKVIDNFQAVHGDKYDYSKVVYDNPDVPVEIICRNHGSYWQKYGTHKAGRGCRTCGTLSKKVTKEKAIIKFKQMHGNLYDYSNIIFVDAKTPITLNCSKHGNFQVRPQTHWTSKASICPDCKETYYSNGVSLNQEECLTRFQKIHGSLYDYSRVEYITQQTKVIIGCAIHGDFLQTPVSHWQGSGCAKCLKIDQTECIKRFKEKHGDYYEYSQVNFKSLNTPVIIICPLHGEFSVLPINHAKSDGHSCVPCNRASRKMKSEDILKRFSDTHKDFYTYLPFEYKSIYQDIEIICPDHGNFYQSINNHMRGTRCPSCWQNSSSKPQLVWGKKVADALGIDLKEEQRPLRGRWGSVDFLFELNDKVFVLEYDGAYWHSRHNSLDKDTRKTKALTDLGIVVVRLRAIDPANRLPALPDVPLAHNLAVNEYPTNIEVSNLVALIKSL